MKYSSYISNDSITMVNPTTYLPKTIRSGDAQYQRVRAAMCKKDYALAWELMQGAAAQIEKAADGIFTVKDGVVRYNGIILNDVINTKLISIITNGQGDCGPVKNYVERILQNSSHTSAMELYDFLGYRELAITPEGMVLAWKGVQDNYYSVMGNLKTVVLQGTVNGSGQILNKVGETIEILRSCCDDNRANTCSYGLHCGSHAYAKSWGQRLLLVQFDPKDAVSVPEDCQCQKLRVCKYTILQEMTGKGEITDPVVDTSKVIKEGSAAIVIESRLPADVIKSAIEDTGYNLFMDNDFHEVVLLVTKGCKISEAMATDEVCAYRENVKQKSADNGTTNVVLQKILAYVAAKGGATVKQIQSTLTIKGLSCQNIFDMIKESGRFIESMSRNGAGVSNAFFDVSSTFGR